MCRFPITRANRMPATQGSGGQGFERPHAHTLAWLGQRTLPLEERLTRGNTSQNGSEMYLSHSIYHNSSCPLEFVVTAET
jgi:hypothetical protein